MTPHTDHNDPQKMRILLVDDNLTLLDAGSRYLERRENFLVDVAYSGSDALTCLRETTYDAVVSDYDMPEMDGLEFRRRLRSEGFMTPFVLFSAMDPDEIQSGRTGSIGRYISKYGNPVVQYSRLADCVREEIFRVQAEGSVTDSEVSQEI